MAQTQFILDLPHYPALDAEDFLVSGCNAQAARLVRAWPDWPGRICLIAGPAGSGKTHLVHVWRKLSGAQAIKAASVNNATLLSMRSPAPMALEDACGQPLDERALFHLLNLARERGFDILITARTPPGEWQTGLPDLRSRFRSLPVVTIGPPDDGLLRAVLIKHFADRQLEVTPDVIEYALVRMERSMAAAARLVDQLDKAALAGRCKITRRLASQVIQAPQGPFAS